MRAPDDGREEFRKGIQLDDAQLATAVYAELHRIASAMMRNRRPGHTLQPTALIHEAWLKLNRTAEWHDKAHFYGSAARAMRQVLIAHARRKSASRRSGYAERITFADIAVHSDEPDLDLIQLDLALEALSKADPWLARVMELRYFAGCTLQEISDLSGRSLATIKRDWTYGRAWLYEYVSARKGV